MEVNERGKQIPIPQGGKGMNNRKNMDGALFFLHHGNMPSLNYFINKYNHMLLYILKI